MRPRKGLQLHQVWGCETVVCGADKGMPAPCTLRDTWTQLTLLTTDCWPNTYVETLHVTYVVIYIYFIDNVYLICIYRNVFVLIQNVLFVNVHEGYLFPLISTYKPILIWTIEQTLNSLCFKVTAVWECVWMMVWAALYIEYLYQCATG